MTTMPVRVFVDEYGDSGLHTEKSGVTAFFILTAVFVPADACEQARVDAEVIRERHFQTGEMKSSKIGDDDVRRARVLADLCQLPITTFSVAIDKREIHKESGLAFKPSFFKYFE